MGLLGPTLGIERGRAGWRGFDLRGPALPPGALLTRAGAASRVDAYGTVIFTGADAARFVPGGLLVEGAATNLVADSRLTGGGWALNGDAARTGGVAAPDGSTDAVRLSIPTGGSIARFVTGLAGGTHVASLWARRPANGGASHLRVTTNNAAAWSTGVSERFALSDSWQRIELAGLLSDGANCNLVLGAATGDAGLDPLCLGEVDLWGAQVEAGDVASSLIQTDGASAGRAADELTLDLGAKGAADGDTGLRVRFADGGRLDLDVEIVGGLAAVPVEALHGRPIARVRLR